MGQGPLSVEELEAVVRRFKKAIVERALGGELTHHLGYPPGGAKPEDAANHRNGTSGKTDRRRAARHRRAGIFEPRLTSSRKASPTPRRSMTPRMDAAGPVGAHRPLENRTDRGFPPRHTHSRFYGEDEINSPHTKFLTLPVQERVFFCFRVFRVVRGRKRSVFVSVYSA